MPKFTFIDLFSGIGGFHAALAAMGGECVFAIEIDRAAAAVYRRNWGIDPLGDITNVANDEEVSVPEHDVLCAGFPCQPFSKSGAQRGMDETRGTVYWNILRIVEERKPAVVFLENVRNLAGPRHLHEWEVIIETLRAEGYRVSETPAIFSPHLLPAKLGGRPQVRERVFITATRLPDGKGLSLEAEPAVTNRSVGSWDPKEWNLESDLPLDDEVTGCELTEAERHWIDSWDEFVRMIVKARKGRPLPGHPLWADEWVHEDDLVEEQLHVEPPWKRVILRKNASFYTSYQTKIDRWAEKVGLYSDLFPPSRRKLEWQAQETPTLWDTVMHLRPSGIRAKAPTHLPALVAINQTSIIGPRRRRIAPHEAARLQGLPEWFDFGEQRDALTYRQLGNGVSVGAVWHVMKAHVERDHDALKWTCPGLLNAVQDAPERPDERLELLQPR